MRSRRSGGGSVTAALARWVTAPVRCACVLFGLALLSPAVLPPTVRAADRTSPLTIVTLGTSLTALGGWQEPLQAALAGCLGRPARMLNLARSGASSAWGVDQVDRVLASRPDVVLLEFAVNDAAVNRWMSIGTSRRHVERILRRLEAADPRPRSIVMGMNPVGGWRGLVRPFLGAYVEAHRQEAVAAGFEFIDHRPAWAALDGDALRAAIPDGLHPDPTIASRLMIPALLRHLAPAACPMVASGATP